MSFEEKGSWAFTFILGVLAAAYFATIVGQLATSTPGEIDYQQRLVGVIAATIVLTVVAMIAMGVLAPQDAGRSDQRDKDIHRLGEYVGGTILAFSMIVPFGLAMAEAEHFWVANAMFLSFVIAGLAGSSVKIVLYRRGL